MLWLNKLLIFLELAASTHVDCSIFSKIFFGESAGNFSLRNLDTLAICAVIIEKNVFHQYVS